MRLSVKLAFALSIAAEPAFAGSGVHHALPPSPDGNLVVGLCDGETSIEVKGVKPGEPLTREQGQQMHPDAGWVIAAAETAGSPGQQPAPAAEHQYQTYGAFTDRDRKIWQESTDKLVAEGKRIFHDVKELGGTNGISCDMCHPDGSNTHPETYPKYQVQLGRVALLRDMINWCIENPVRGKPLPDDDPKLKALEAYILAQRKGVALEYGKH